VVPRTSQDLGPPGGGGAAALAPLLIV
jgi:hypothetical protein